MPEQASIHYIRIASKERPTDRFLTVQIREGESHDDEAVGDLYFLVEIHNPWFPNSQIGQTIINTIAREYRRGESTSLLANFEGALRKTNQALAQITQNGETDWIGNLSSLVALVTDNHLHVAQTGKAHGYLVRGDRVTEITEGLDEEANHHPLTTYTNITSGTLEPGDRILLASADTAEHFSHAELKPILRENSLGEAGREFVRATQRLHLRRINAFLLEANAPKGTLSETIYQDQSLNNPTAVAKRLTQTVILPALNRSQTLLRTGTLKTRDWSRDWLIPRVIDWSNRGRTSLMHHTQTLVTKSQPALKKVTDSVTHRLPEQLKKTLRSDRHLAKVQTENLTNRTIYRVHHYGEQLTSSGLNLGQWLKTKLASAGAIFPVLKKLKLPRLRRKFTRGQLLLLCGAVVVIGIVAVSVSQRRTQQVASNRETAAARALVAARTNQQAGERAFILDQKDIAAAKFTEAIVEAKLAAEESSNHTAASEIITRSQTILDQLFSITRLDQTPPLGTVSQAILSLMPAGDKIGLVAQNEARILIVTPTTSEERPTSLTLPSQVASARASVRIDQTWYLAGKDQTLIHVDTTNFAIDTTKGTADNWPVAQALAHFGTTLYLLDASAGQIWKYTPKNDRFSEAKPFLKTADPAIIGSAIDLAIDGDIFVLHKNGTLQKYTKGEPQTDWQLASLPKGSAPLSAPIQVFTDADSQEIYLFEPNTDTAPGRLITFAKTGQFVRQILFPNEWKIEALSFDPQTKQGYLVSLEQIFEFTIGLN